MLPLMFKPMAMILPRGFTLPGPTSLIPARLNPPEPGPMPEPYQLELIRSYATAGFTAVVTINSGALIAGLSQVKNIDFVPPVAIAVALLIWAIGVTTGVATWGAAFNGVVAQAAADRETQMRWRRVAAGLFHTSLGMFLLGFLVVGVSSLTWWSA
jgi:hypothetical protein